MLVILPHENMSKKTRPDTHRYLSHDVSLISFQEKMVWIWFRQGISDGCSMRYGRLMAEDGCAVHPAEDRNTLDIEGTGTAVQVKYICREKNSFLFPARGLSTHAGNAASRGQKKSSAELFGNHRSSGSETMGSVTF